jgi:hypothetical protein
LTRVDRFDVEFHVRELALSAPGDDRQLAEYRIRGPSITPILDGVSGTEVLGALLDPHLPDQYLPDPHL